MASANDHLCPVSPFTLQLLPVSLMLMAKRPSKSEADKPIRPLIDGELGEAVKYETAQLGLRQPIDMVRLALTERYKKLGWLVPGEGGQLVFRMPTPDSSEPEPS